MSFGFTLRRQAAAGISSIRAGDHIIYARRIGAWHHEVVTNVDPPTDTFEAIGFSREDGNRVYLGKFERKYKSLDEQFKIHVAQYIIHDPKVRCFPNEEVARRANQAYLGNAEISRTYKMLSNNCEHFATWCKTGIAAAFERDLLYDLKPSWMPKPVSDVFFQVGELAGPYGPVMLVTLRSSIYKATISLTRNRPKKASQ